jgi:outer membrane immunogenic protein
MKKTLIAGALITGAMLGSAMAADMPVKAPIMKAMAPVYNWTGCYIGGGGGYGMWNQETFMESDPGHIASTETVTIGGRGWFGTATLGCDYQVSSSIVIGAYGDGDFGDIKGQISPPGLGSATTESEKRAWAAGGRIGWLVTPTVLTYFSGGYTQAHFDPIELAATQGSAAFTIAGNTYHGWFLGSGFDYAISILPSGFFLRSEYRYSTYQAADVPLFSVGVPQPEEFNSKKWVQTVRTELTYRFNWH